MKILPSLICILFSLHVSARSGENSIRISVINPAAIDRKAETVGVCLTDLRGKGLAGDVDQLIVADKKSGQNLLYQIGEDTLLFQADFKSGEEREFLIRQADQSMARPSPLVDGRFEKPREDYAWENDRIAFRMYGPALAAEVNNGIDVWTKRVRYLIVEKWYRESAMAGKDTYHEDHGEGADLFSVGRSLGAGGAGLWLDGKVRQPGVFSSCRTIQNGPIRVAFELVYNNWNAGGRVFTEHVRISLDAGTNLNRIQLMFDVSGANDSLPIACGLVKRAGTTADKDESNLWASVWGPTTNDMANGFLGTGIVFSPLSFTRFTADSDQYLVMGSAKVGEPFVYYAGAGWTGSSDFATESAWKSYLADFARRLLSPLEVKIHAD